MSFLGSVYLLHPFGHALRDHRPSFVLVHTEGGKYFYMATWKVAEAEVGNDHATKWLEDCFVPNKEVLPVGDLLFFVTDLRNGNIERTPHAAAAAAAAAPAAPAAVPAAAAAADAPPAMIEASPAVHEAQVHVTARAEAAEEPPVLRAIDGADVNAAVDHTAMSSKASAAAAVEPSRPNMPDPEAGDEERIENDVDDEEPAKNKRPRSKTGGYAAPAGAPPPQRSAQNNKRPRPGPVAAVAAAPVPARRCQHGMLRKEGKSKAWIRYNADTPEKNHFWFCDHCKAYYNISEAAWWCSNACNWCICDKCAVHYPDRKE